jgi:hypothetical protein
MSSGSKTSHFSASLATTVASSICSPQPPALRSCSRCLFRLRVKDHPRTPLYHPDPPSSSRRLSPPPQDTQPLGHARGHTRTHAHEQDAPAFGQRTSVPGQTYIRATTSDMRWGAMSATTATSAARRGATRSCARTVHGRRAHVRPRMAPTRGGRMQGSGSSLSRRGPSYYFGVYMRATLRGRALSPRARGAGTRS